MKTFYYCLNAFIASQFFLIDSSEILAQIPTQVDPSKPEKPLILPKDTQESSLESTPLPKQPILKPNITSKITVTDVEFIDNTAFSDEELTAQIQNFISQELTFTDLIQIEEIITNYYVSNGYVNSGAVIEAGQTLKPDNAIVKVTLIEGGVEDIKVTGTRRLNQGYISSRIGLAVQKPLNQNQLLEALQLLQLDPLIQNISAKLSPGIRPDLSIVQVEVVEAESFDLDLFVNNGRSSSVGSVRRGVAIQEQNLLGLGDSINLSYTNTDGSDGYNFSYTVPVSPTNTTIRFAGGYSDSEIISRVFNELDITGESLFYEVSLRQPIIQKPTQELALGVTFSRQESTNFLAGERFPLAFGADEDGEVRISAIRFFQDWVKRNPRDVIAFNSQFSFGVNAFDATDNPENIPDSNFFSWRGQGQYVRLLAEDSLLIIRSDLQFANQRLLSLEQFSVGGLGTVRGYPQDLFLTDNGLVISAETRFPILRVPSVDGLLQVTPFVDFGVAWNNDRTRNPNPDPNTLVGAGFGLLWQMGNSLTARIDWGIPLVDVDVEKDSLNDSGVYFNVNYTF